MFVIAYVLVASGIGSIEPGLLTALKILAIAEGGVMAVELVYRALNLFAWETVPLVDPPVLTAAGRGVGIRPPPQPS